ncbi:MauE/DoxX family redox-associated membrane protein [uncultured Croceitalea sp.]|uniref:heavy metal translocating P-type ATPase n=1 Tax=uncultured Croceitalea sp. TaxID=1798908 RepID=UPI0033066B41
MKQAYKVSGMTCQGCVASVKNKLESVDGVQHVTVDLEKGAVVELNHSVAVKVFQQVLSDKYRIEEKSTAFTGPEMSKNVSKWMQLRPLFLIFSYLLSASILLHVKNWSTTEAMLDFMGLFYIVFSFFKLLDLKGFPESFRMYDPLARALPVYAWVYPFIELGLGLLFLMRLQLPLALLVTVFVLGITTIGVVQTLISKKKIKCACLGTALQLPMSEATFIENAIMLLMAGFMMAQVF